MDYALSLNETLVLLLAVGAYYLYQTLIEIINPKYSRKETERKDQESHNG